MTGDDDLLREFLLESVENLDRLDQDFVALEREPDDRERLGAIFRTIHTIKGTSGFFDLSRLESLTHAGETLLSRLRDGELALDGAMTSALLATVDAVRGMLASIEADGSEGSLDIAPLVAELARLGAQTRLTPR
ncbi:MAG: Hpt domain-containing protein, partial [Labilithrix sp.]|nr:Hpt domain-containing protein [Labilithrix sp.]